MNNKCDKCGQEVKKKSLEDKFIIWFDENFKYRPYGNSEELAKIAEEHFKEAVINSWTEMAKRNGYVKKSDVLEAFDKSLKNNEKYIKNWLAYSYGIKYLRESLENL